MIYASSEELKMDQPNCAKELLIDNDYKTFWQSRFSSQKEFSPHEIRIDLGAKAQLNGITLVPRQRNSSGKCSAFEIRVSDDAKVWRLAAEGSFYWAGNNDFSNKVVDISAVGRYIQYKHLKTYSNAISDTAVASLAEFKVEGVYVEPIIVADFDVLCTEKYLQVGAVLMCKSTTQVYQSDVVSYLWSCKGASLKNATSKNCEIRFDKTGVYEIALQVRNSKGMISNKVAHKPIFVLPAHPIDNRMIRIDTCSDENTEYKHGAVNTISDFDNSYWQTSWDQLVPLPHFIVYDLGASALLSGIGFIPLQTSNEGLIKACKVYVSHDGKAWGTPVVNVSFASPYKTLQLMSFEKVEGRYVKFQIDKAFASGSNFVAFSRFYVYGEYINPILKYSLIGIVVFVLVIFVFVIFRLWKKKTHNKSDINSACIGNEKSSSMMLDYTTHIRFFGNFSVIHNQKDITVALSPKLKQLFVLMSYSPEGVSIHKLGEYLWPGMPPDNTINTRGTTILRLKAACKDIPGLSFVYKQKTWLVQMDNSVYFDFKRYNQLKILLDKQFSLSLVKELCLVIKSPLLTDIEEEWLDSIKEKVTNEVIDLLLSLIENKEVVDDKNVLLMIVEVLLTLDELNEEALKLKITTLISFNKNGSAKMAFENFTKKYQQFYGEAFSKDFSSFSKSLD